MSRGRRVSDYLPEALDLDLHEFAPGVLIGQQQQQQQKASLQVFLLK